MSTVRKHSIMDNIVPSAHRPSPDTVENIVTIIETAYELIEDWRLRDGNERSDGRVLMGGQLTTFEHVLNNLQSARDGIYAILLNIAGTKDPVGCPDCESIVRKYGTIHCVECGYDGPDEGSSNALGMLTTSLETRDADPWYEDIEGPVFKMWTNEG